MPLKNQIIVKRELSPKIVEMELYNPEIASKVKVGQFIIIKIEEESERIPLSIVDWNLEKGTIKIVFQKMGVSTHKLGKLNVGNIVMDVLGPLGNPLEINRFGIVICIGEGIRIPTIYPIARELKNVGNRVISIIGAESRDLLVYENEMMNVSDELKITTHDGSIGKKNFVYNELEELLNYGLKIDRVLVSGSTMIMKKCAEITKPHNIKTTAILTPIMLCGVGICGACRIEFEGKIKFTCLEGLEFDAHKVNFDLLLARLNMYRSEEEKALKNYFEIGGE
ncbi:MAG: sulfide/dihydroorotate dehydrogenase-like FAD/NAD-binding protein [Candidatus Methanomethylicia archaeon]|nr:sulfide/dihydroorotate dehydrogenase-like FAD/NAD-binding protein [Candidatus Methanomethylicia archaeon]MDW7988539.1 sulfide/dihydroorotate dehydrogenase-like FAD/NAD-binding protein [Nitrososphaerota archaeon]